MSQDTSSIPPSTFVQHLLDSRSSEIESIYRIASTLNTGLDKKVVAVLLDLIEQGVHPESLADSK